MSSVSSDRIIISASNDSTKTVTHPKLWLDPPARPRHTFIFFFLLLIFRTSCGRKPGGGKPVFVNRIGKSFFKNWFSTISWFTRLRYDFPTQHANADEHNSVTTRAILVLVRRLRIFKSSEEVILWWLRIFFPSPPPFNRFYIYVTAFRTPACRIHAAKRFIRNRR